MSRSHVEIGHALLRYVGERPRAADTLKGIVSWWWQRQAYADAFREVETALEGLVETGVLEKRQWGSGDILYFLPKRLEEDECTEAGNG